MMLCGVYLLSPATPFTAGGRASGYHRKRAREVRVVHRHGGLGLAGVHDGIEVRSG